MENYKNPKEGKTYISPSLKSFGQSNERVIIASKVITSPDSYAFAKVRDEVILRHKKDAKTYISAKFIEDDRGIFVLSIQGYTVASDKPHNASFTFIGDEIGTLMQFVKNIQAVQLDNSGPINISDEEFNKVVLSNEQAKLLFDGNEEIFTEILKSKITKEDLVAVGYRKKQLDVFEKLLTNNEYFESLKAKINCLAEALWQKFFEKNQWIFGYGLGYIFLTGLDDKKLEQVVQGYSVNNFGKRVDALMKTNGMISNLCFVEIKTHRTDLLEKKPYRSGCYAPSEELVGAIAQIQGTVASAIDTIASKINLEDKDGNPTREEIFNYQPKSYLVIGNLDEFRTEQGVNKNKYRSFELFRKNILNPEIITFDELFERAKFIVKKNES
jgi:hypothetical protein